jgi:hypothetical protein
MRFFRNLLIGVVVLIVLAVGVAYLCRGTSSWSARW